MFVIRRACPYCGILETVNLSDGRPLCINCTLLRRPGGWSRGAREARGPWSALRPAPLS